MEFIVLRFGQLLIALRQKMEGEKHLIATINFTAPVEEPRFVSERRRFRQHVKAAREDVALGGVSRTGGGRVTHGGGVSRTAEAVQAVCGKLWKFLRRLYRKYSGLSAAS